MIRINIALAIFLLLIVFFKRTISGITFDSSKNILPHVISKDIDSYIYIKRDENPIDTFTIEISFKDQTFIMYKKSKNQHYWTNYLSDMIKFKAVTNDYIHFVPLDAMLEGAELSIITSQPTVVKSSVFSQVKDSIQPFIFNKLAVTFSKPTFSKDKTNFIVKGVIKSSYEPIFVCDLNPNKTCHFDYHVVYKKTQVPVPHTYTIYYPVSELYINQSINAVVQIGSSLIIKNVKFTSKVPPYDIEFTINHQSNQIRKHFYSIPNINLAALPTFLSSNYSDTYKLANSIKKESDDVLEYQSVYYNYFKYAMNNVEKVKLLFDSSNKTNQSATLDDIFALTTKYINFEHLMDNGFKEDEIYQAILNQVDWDTISLIIDKYLGEIVEYYKEEFEMDRLELVLFCNSKSNDNIEPTHTIKTDSDKSIYANNRVRVPFNRLGHVTNWRCEATNSILTAKSNVIEVQLVKSVPKAPLVIVFGKAYNKNNDYTVSGDEQITLLILTSSDSEVDLYEIEITNEQNQVIGFQKYSEPAISFIPDIYKYKVLYKVYVNSKEGRSLPTTVSFYTAGIDQIMNITIKVKYIVIGTFVTVFLFFLAIIIAVQIFKNKYRKFRNNFNSYQTLDQVDSLVEPIL